MVAALKSALKARPRLRADAQRNRERIVDAAREMFVEYGAEVPLDEVARRAGVGNATLYRHFPDRRELIHHVTLHVMARIAEQAERALAEEPDAFEALRRWVHAAADERVGALCPLLSESVDRNHPDHLEARDRLNRDIEALMERAREAGQLRADIDVGDLMVAITQLTRPLPGWGSPRAESGGGCVDFDRFVHRHLQLFLDGLRAPARSELPGSAATLEDLRQQN
ncbi:TetR/AcrR family transcriptional regulator [Streptomyces pathocidini]|uniref:TetR/AcrR family transcriptional regulator n=1 Tax=Streptomyces pathocidini TaxID=1650571 RepID=A0ABW7USU1_9ACTN|nr:TetR/AcrR family transcriptional regulator [Streptomyces pathocidini]